MSQREGQKDWKKREQGLREKRREIVWTIGFFFFWVAPIERRRKGQIGYLRYRGGEREREEVKREKVEGESLKEGKGWEGLEGEE